MVVDTTGLASRLDLDPDTGRVICDAGVSLRRLSAVVHEHGWLLPVYPGTAFVTVGGAIANDVHGKEQHVRGSIGGHVVWFDLILPDGTPRRVIPTVDVDLFRATIGGIGLTGVIVAVCLQLIRRTTNAMIVEERRVNDLESMVRTIAEAAPRYPSLVAWVDLMAFGRNAGRGVVELAAPAPEDAPEVRPRAVHEVPFMMPDFLLNRLSISAFNALYFRRVPASGRQRVVHWNRFAFPLDAVGEWHRVYGARGLYQFQCCVPSDVAVETFVALREELRRAHLGSMLAVMKRVGEAGLGDLSFAQPGYSLAMDFPGGAESVALIHRLHAHVLQAGGRVYLAKDACLRPSEYRAMYPRAGSFTEVLDRIDPDQRMQSDMSRRLAVR